MPLEINQKSPCAQLAKTLMNVKTIVLIAHVSPDGDVIGSLLALRSMCLQLNNVKLVDAVIVGNVPDIYKFLPGSNCLKNPDNKSILKEYDLAIAVDVASKDRLGTAVSLFDTAKNTALIDHHGSNPLFSNINFVDENAAATGELVYQLFNYLDVSLNKDIATNLYAAILTDTGGFKFANTTEHSLYICSKMIAAGANAQEIYQECYENKPLAMLMLHAHCMCDAKLIESNKIAWTTVPRSLLNKLGAKDDHVEGIIELLRQIDTVEVALLFKESKDGSTKVSFRSKKIDICSIAQEYNGGGHKCAAGCTLKDLGIEKAIEHLIPKIIALLS